MLFQPLTRLPSFYPFYPAHYPTSLVALPLDANLVICPLDQCPAYRQGYAAALSDGQAGWSHCWLPARELAEAAVYGPGLSQHERGYAAGLAQLFPGGLDEISAFLGPLQLPGSPIRVLEASSLPQPNDFWAIAGQQGGA